MPSPAHEWMVALLTEDPALLDALLRALHRAGLPARFAVVDATLHLTDSVELRPDALLLEPLTGRWIALEVQLQIDEEKRATWPLLATWLHRRHGVMGDVLVITPSERVAGWASAGWRHDGDRGTLLHFAPAVLRLGEAEARALLDAPSPEMAFFAAWAMQDRHGPAAQEIVLAALRRADEVADDTLKMSLTRSILAVLSDALKEVLPAMIALDRMPKLEPWLEDLIKRWEDKGRSEGEARGEARALIRVLQRRGIALDAATEARIAACDDLTVLDGWIERAATAVTLRDVFGEA